MNSTTEALPLPKPWRYFWYCHRLPERTLRWRGKLFPVCARCTGLWLGYCFGIILLTVYLIPLWLSVALAIPLLADGVTQALGWRASTPLLRLSTGLAAGIGEVMFISHVITFAFLLGYRMV